MAKYSEVTQRCLSDRPEKPHIVLWPNDDGSGFSYHVFRCRDYFVTNKAVLFCINKSNAAQKRGLKS